MHKTKEIKLLKNEETISRTDINGNILYFNNIFSKISGYNRAELTHVPHSILRHPDMPKAIFYIIWKTLLAGNSTYAIVKNQTKKGDYYWQLIKFSPIKDNQNRTISFISHGVQAPKEVVEEITPLYQELLNIEEYNSNEAIKFFLNFLNSNNIATYNDYILRVKSENKKLSLFESWLEFDFI